MEPPSWGVGKEADQRQGNGLLSRDEGLLRLELINV